ncbi:hypothetical protein THER_0027 [Thermodesulfovibrio sp. N1]|nr:hypothetical protein THER_0027 [Thermodesulfovibrio sp. N1]
MPIFAFCEIEGILDFLNNMLPVIITASNMKIIKKTFFFISSPD